MEKTSNKVERTPSRFESQKSDRQLILDLAGLGSGDLAIAGGKGANLGELLRAGFPVPGGFVVTTAAYDDFVAHNRLEETIRQELSLHPGSGAAIRATFERYPHIGNQLPSMGYSEQQVLDLEATINLTECDLVIFSTPIDLTCLLKINKPALRVRYDYKDHGPPLLEDVVVEKFQKMGVL